MHNESASGPSRILAPLESGFPWVIWGLIVQTLGVGAVAAVMWRNMRNAGLAGHITAELVRFAWRSELHTRAGLIVLVAGAVIYAAGSVVMARPYVRRPAALFVAVPIAAVAGMLVLGVLALVVALVIGFLLNGSGGIGGGFGRRGRNTSRRDRE